MSTSRFIQKTVLVMRVWVLRLWWGPNILCWLVRGCRCWGSSSASLGSHLYRAPGLRDVPPLSEASSRKLRQTCWCTQIYRAGDILSTSMIKPLIDSILRLGTLRSLTLFWHFMQLLHEGFYNVCFWTLATFSLIFSLCTKLFSWFFLDC